MLGPRNGLVPDRRQVDVGRPQQPAEIQWDDVTQNDVLGLEVGYRLIPLVDRTQGGELIGRITGVRKKLSRDLGFLVQPVHIRDNLDMAPTGYRLLVLGDDGRSVPPPAPRLRRNNKLKSNNLYAQ